MLEVEKKYKEYKTKINDHQKKVIEFQEMNTDGNTMRKMDPNLEPQYWKENFLYPFALERPPPPGDMGVTSDGLLIDEGTYKFPLKHLEKGKEGVLEEL